MWSFMLHLSAFPTLNHTLESQVMCNSFGIKHKIILEKNVQKKWFLLKKPLASVVRVIKISVFHFGAQVLSLLCMADRAREMHLHSSLFLPLNSRPRSCMPLCWGSYFPLVVFGSLAKPSSCLEVAYKNSSSLPERPPGKLCGSRRLS